MPFLQPAAAIRAVLVSLVLSCCLRSVVAQAPAEDHVARVQEAAMHLGHSPLGYWGTNPEKYSDWTTHSNRLIPIYTYGSGVPGGPLNLDNFTGRHSVYRNSRKVRQLYGRVPEGTVYAAADWMDQTQVAELQRLAAATGRKHIFLVIFDGMDWQTTRAAAIYNQQAVTYSSGRGTGTHFQNYTANGTSQYAWLVTSPHNSGTQADADQQIVTNIGGKIRGGYSAAAGGRTPWQQPPDPGYLIQSPQKGNPKHAYTDSAASATSLMAGIKTYYNAVNVDPTGVQVSTVAHELQADGWGIGVVTSVPISHATPASAYAHNVTRKDYQDITRDLLGLPSVSHPEHPLSGMDVVIGAGFGETAETGPIQGDNFVPGNVYLTDADLQRASVSHGGRYHVAMRTSGKRGASVLFSAAKAAAARNHRLLGFFGIGQYESHLPWQTANGDYKPVKDAEAEPQVYSQADILENPTLADMTTAALTVLEKRERFWLMVEAGDIDWANHDNNIDNAIGAVNSGDEAVRVITEWVEKNSNWNETLLIVTADHGHMFTFLDPAVLITPTPPPVHRPEGS